MLTFIALLQASIAGCDLLPVPPGVTRPQADSECVGICTSDDPSNPAPPVAISKPEVRYTLRGAYGAWDELVISAGGVATRLHSLPEIPNLTRLLSEAEHDSLLSSVRPLQFLNRSVWGATGCSETTERTVEFRNPSDDLRLTRRVYLGCSGVVSDTTGEVQTIVNGLETLGALSDQIVSTQAVWRGLQMRFGLSKVEFSRTDTVKFRLAILNPTTGERTLYFSSSLKTRLRIRTTRREGLTIWNIYDSGFGSRCWGSNPQCPFDWETIAPGDSLVLQNHIPAIDLFDGVPDGIYLAEYYLQSPYLEWPWRRFEFVIR
jgi:hypothetical protein